MSTGADQLATKQDLALLLVELRRHLGDGTGGLKAGIRRSHKTLMRWGAALGALILATQIAGTVAILTQM